MDDPEAALRGVRKLVADVVTHLRANNEPIPQPRADTPYSGKFITRVPPDLHRQLALEAAQEQISLNRLVSMRLSAQPSPRGLNRAFLPDGATQRSPSPAFLGNRTNALCSMRKAGAGTPKRTRIRKGVPAKA